MWKKPGVPVPLDPSQVVVGLYVWLDIPWAEHPFLTSRIMVKTSRDVSIIRSSNPRGRLYYYPDQSSVVPPAPKLEPAGVDTVTEAQKAEQLAMVREMQELKAAKAAKQSRQQAALLRADKAWDDAARATRDALLNLTRSPKVAGDQLRTLAMDTARTIASGQEILLHLLGDKKGKGPQFHALNTMTLAMLAGKAAGLTESELADLAMASLAHDAGISEIPAKVVQTAKRKKFEEDFYRQHVKFSVQFATQSGAFSRDALAAIADHHECADGTGWPQAKKGSTKVGNILAMVDSFEHLCTPEALDQDPMMPAEALSYMFRYQAERFDLKLLGMFIKQLGIYPPGTVVQLSDGSLGLVVSPGPNSLQPTVMLYAPESSKMDAPIVDLSAEADLKIVEAIRPNALAPEVMAWLNPEKRLSYFYSINYAIRDGAA